MARGSSRRDMITLVKPKSTCCISKGPHGKSLRRTVERGAGGTRDLRTVYGGCYRSMIRESQGTWCKVSSNVETPNAILEFAERICCLQSSYLFGTPLAPVSRQLNSCFHSSNNSGQLAEPSRYTKPTNHLSIQPTVVGQHLEKRPGYRQAVLFAMSGKGS